MDKLLRHGVFCIGCALGSAFAALGCAAIPESRETESVASNMAACTSINGGGILVFAPHEDDETIACSGIIERANQIGADIRLVMVTNGDFWPGGTPEDTKTKARDRITKTINAVGELGLTKDRIIYLGYADNTVIAYAYNDPTAVFTSTDNATNQTYGFPAPDPLDIVDYHYAKYGSHALYDREDILLDVRTVLNEYRPKDIYIPSVMESHLDHSATALYVIEALKDITQESYYAPTLHEYMIYKDGLPQSDLNALEPVSNVEADMDNTTPYSFSERDSVSVPEEMYASIDSGTNLKLSAFDQYLGDAGGYYRFIRSDEVFWTRSMANLAFGATATASSDTPATGQLASKAIDGVEIGYPYANGLFSLDDKEWATTGELAGAFIQLDWHSDITANRIVLFDRPNFDDHVSSGTLRFSDGSSIAVDSLPNHGSGKVIDFATKTFNWVRFTVDQAEGFNVGLSEFEVYDRTSNIASDAVVNVSSQNVNQAQFGTKAVDGVVAEGSSEWASIGQLGGAWIRLSWPQPETVNRIVLYDRPSSIEHVLSGILTFSDGSSLRVGPLPNHGSGKPVTFPAKTITWVKFLVGGAKGSSVGLSEFEVFGYPLDVPLRNIALRARATASSQTQSSRAIKAIDGWRTGAPAEETHEWKTADAGNGSWLRLDWDRLYVINQVVLYDRPSRTDRITQGTLRFSDGTSVAVGALPNDGQPKIVSLPTHKIVRWLALQADVTIGVAGLAELEVMGVPVD